MALDEDLAVAGITDDPLLPFLGIRFESYIAIVVLQVLIAVAPDVDFAVARITDYPFFPCLCIRAEPHIAIAVLQVCVAVALDDNRDTNWVERVIVGALLRTARCGICDRAKQGTSRRGWFLHPVDVNMVHKYVLTSGVGQTFQKTALQCLAREFPLILIIGLAARLLAQTRCKHTKRKTGEKLHFASRHVYRP